MRRSRAFLTAAAIALSGLLGGCGERGGTMAAALVVQSEPELDVPYVPTPQPVVAAMLDMAEVGPEDYVIDLGSGDGRIPIEAARRGARAFGVDINPVRVREANENARIAGVEDRVRFRRQDLFATPIREASVVTMYLLPRVNLELRPRILTELRPGTRVVSHAFHMGDWEADEMREVDHASLYLWIVPAPVGGEWALSLADGRTLTLELEQRFQQISGTLGGRPLRDLRLRGAELSFTANLGRGRQRFHGIWDGAAIAPAPDARDGAATGWQARRIS